MTKSQLRNTKSSKSVPKKKTSHQKKEKGSVSNVKVPSVRIPHINEKIKALFKDKKWYNGTIVKVIRDGHKPTKLEIGSIGKIVKVYVVFDDGDEEIMIWPDKNVLFVDGDSEEEEETPQETKKGKKSSKKVVEEVEESEEEDIFAESDTVRFNG